jgi:hypothetical protein
MGDETGLAILIRRAAARNAGLEVRTLVTRLTDIDGADDPLLMVKLNALPPVLQEYLARRLCEILEAKA